MSSNIRLDPDKDHLNLLGIFHYVLAGMNAFTGCIPIVHVSMGVAMLLGAFDGAPNPPPAMMGLLFASMGGFMMLFFWGLATLKLLAGRWLRSRQHYTFCFVVACVECLQMPWGTVLGVFTILALLRPNVKRLFEGIEPRDLDFDDPADDDQPLPPPPPAKPDDAIQEDARTRRGPTSQN